ncbi:hypothetical protein [Sinorhizobium fredii]|uniref:hypothetical protein n=1 Tax=Rhizobium fredii TaxID=380 RepID=UPI00055E51ED|nr:hypothetical protein [Sinorhizobium fredii]
MSEIESDIGPLPDLPRKKGRKKRTVSQEEMDRLKSPEHIDRLKRVGFQKGREKTGGRVPTPKETKEWLAGKTQDVAELLYDMAFDDTIPAKERMKAAMWIAEMNISKAPTEQTVNVNHNHQISDMMARINEDRQARQIEVGSKPMKDITPAAPVIDANFVPLEIEDEGDDHA